MESKQERQILCCQVIFPNLIRSFPILEDKWVSRVEGWIADDELLVHELVWSSALTLLWQQQLMASIYFLPLLSAWSHCKSLEIHSSETLYLCSSECQSWPMKILETRLYLIWCSRSKDETQENVLLLVVICSRTFPPKLLWGGKEIKIKQFVWPHFSFDER